MNPPLTARNTKGAKDTKGAAVPLVPAAVAVGLWFIMFSPWTAPHLNFWLSMLFSACVLLSMSFGLGKDWKAQFSLTPRAVVVGILSAILLWGIFYLGNFFSNLLFDFARPQVHNIYGLRDGNNHGLIALELLLVIGPAETVFWQGFIQRKSMDALGAWPGFIVTTLIYAFAHIWSFNFMLLMAALVCGAFWGFMYMALKPRNLVPLLISHAAWDVMVFILFPII
ncbi:MAG: CPBP family intramembrane metalloprotease [Zoogloeaceae bacterium]|jgi:membrane protease YdiL (CAAX protease family)|nr:CPBP family intramembrane metalloprotease [Zoogloeaceae bacterium]